MNFENISSIGLKSGLYGGSGKTLAPTRSIASDTAGDKCDGQAVSEDQPCERHLDRASPGRPKRASQGGMTDGRSDRDASMA